VPGRVTQEGGVSNDASLGLRAHWLKAAVAEYPTTSRGPWHWTHHWQLLTAPRLLGEEVRSR